MTLAELQRVLRAADPAAVLVSPRVLERVIQQVCDLHGLVWNVPHRQSFVVDRHVLFHHVEQDDLNLESDQLLPPTVILLARPAAEEISGQQPGPILLKFWRRLFHASVHLRLDTRYKAGELTLGDIRTRIDRIGQAEFEEVRTVLTQDAYLPADADDRAVYIEFASVFLELRYFASNLLPIYFPGIRDPARVEQLLTQDLDAEGLFQQTRLTGAPMPVVRTTHTIDETHEFYWKLVRSAERAVKAGNIVKAAILRTRAARVAPAAFSPGTRADAEAHLHKLTGRLKVALHLSEAEAADLLKDLVKLLDKADQGRQPVEAALLYDLQRVCLDNEREIFALDVVEWLLSAGKRPIKRPLPGQRLVRITRHLRSAVQRLTMARLADVDRQHLTELLQSALAQAEERLRARFRPVLVAVFEDVGLHPRNPPEVSAFHKMIEEMLDRVREYGFLTFSDLRDTLSRNQLKLPDLSDPQDFVRGDPLLRLDRRLSTLMDGVYRPSEVYMRWLERLTALNFGTPAGRLLTRFVTLPFGGAFLILEGSMMLLDKMGVPPVSKAGNYSILIFLGFFLMALMHSGPLRRRCAEIGRRVFEPVRIVFYDLPMWLVRIPWLRRLLTSWPAQLCYWYILKPLLVCALLWFWLPWAFQSVPAALGTFLAVNFLLNSRFGHAITDSLSQGLVNFYNLLRAGLVPGLIDWIQRGFKHVTDTVEYLFFSVDEFLRFRSGDTRLSMGIRAVLGVLWFPISYVTRFYVVVLIEPTLNPLKFPIASIAYKFVLPFTPQLTELFAEPLVPILGSVPSYLFAGATVWLLPDAFAFLVWETKENWSLYRANRPATIRPVPIGGHGETMRHLLQPGFHSGTVPRLYARLRSAERTAAASGNWRVVRTYRHSLEEVGEAVQQFVARELVSLLEQSTSWQGQPLNVGRVYLACNRLSVELVHGGFPQQPLWLEFEARLGWMLASIPQAGWLNQLGRDQLGTLVACLANLYKLADIDLVREQIRANLPAAVASYDITATSLVLWLDQRHGTAILYDLRSSNGQLEPRTPEGRPAPDWPVLDARRAIFARVPLSWKDWVQAWEQERAAGFPRLPHAQLDLAQIAPPLPLDASLNGALLEADGPPRAALEREGQRTKDEVQRIQETRPSRSPAERGNEEPTP